MQPPGAYDENAEVGNPVTRALALLILERASGTGSFADVDGSVDNLSLELVAKHASGFFEEHPNEPSFAAALGPYKKKGHLVVLELDGEALSAVTEGFKILADEVQEKGFRASVLEKLKEVAQCHICEERP